jgi:hypothetical protein
LSRCGIQPGGLSLEETMEGLRQALCMIYVALAEAAGGDAVLRQANEIIRDGLEDGVIDDPDGAWILDGIVEGTERELKTIGREIQIERPEYRWWDEINTLAATAH